MQKYVGALSKLGIGYLSGNAPGLVAAMVDVMIGMNEEPSLTRDDVLAIYFGKARTNLESAALAKSSDNRRFFLREAYSSLTLAQQTKNLLELGRVHFLCGGCLEGMGETDLGLRELRKSYEASEKAEAIAYDVDRFGLMSPTAIVQGTPSTRLRDAVRNGQTEPVLTANSVVAGALDPTAKVQGFLQTLMQCKSISRRAAPLALKQWVQHQYASPAAWVNSAGGAKDVLVEAYATMRPVATVLRKRGPAGLIADPAVLQPLDQARATEVRRKYLDRSCAKDSHWWTASR